MDLQQVLSITIGTLITVVAAHLAVYWVVKTLYPPPPQVVLVPTPMAPVPEVPVFTPPTVPVQQQNVELPTYAPRVPVETADEERKGPPPPEDTSIRRKPGVGAADAQ
jgi:hypothetical protein